MSFYPYYSHPSHFFPSNCFNFSTQINQNRIDGNHHDVLDEQDGIQHRNGENINERVYTPFRQKKKYKKKAPDIFKEPKRILDCPKCHKDFYHNSSYLYHLSTIHYTSALWNEYGNSDGLSKNSISNNCRLCGKEFTSKTTFLAHVGGKHRKVIDFCSDDILRQFDNEHINEPNSSYIRIVNKSLIFCTYCGSNSNNGRRSRSFKDPTQLKQHLVSHCKQQFYNKYTPFGTVCPYCTKKFPSFINMVYHVGSKHNMIMDFISDEAQQLLESLGVRKSPSGDEATHLEEMALKIPLRIKEEDPTDSSVADVTIMQRAAAAAVMYGFGKTFNNSNIITDVSPNQYTHEQIHDEISIKEETLGYVSS